MIEDADKFGFKELDCTEIVKLFFDEPMISCEGKITSHGETDFREALLVQLATGNRYVIKLADNDFTVPDRIKMWQRCAADYRKLGYYAPAIYPAKTGEFPVIRYKGHSCVAYAEEFAKYAYADDVGKGLASSRYFSEILTMTAKVANLYSDYASYPSGYCLFTCFSPSDEEDEVMENAREWKRYAETLPAIFQPQVERIWRMWSENRNVLQAVYAELPTSIFQADLNSSNILVDDNGDLAGVFDFNLCGKDVFLNYLFREINWEDDETELELLRSAIFVVRKEYDFSPAEKDAALKIYRCVKPLWYTKTQRIKNAGNDFEVIRMCLDRAESALTADIDFFL